MRRRNMLQNICQQNYVKFANLINQLGFEKTGVNAQTVASGLLCTSRIRLNSFDIDFTIFPENSCERTRPRTNIQNPSSRWQQTRHYPGNLKPVKTLSPVTKRIEIACYEAGRAAVLRFSIRIRICDVTQLVSPAARAVSSADFESSATALHS